MNNPFTTNLLLIKLKRQDPDAFGELYDAYVERIYRFIFFKVNNQAEAQDLASETFLKFWQYVKADKPIKNVNALLYTIARNLVIDHYRSRQRQYDQEVPIDQIEIADQRDYLAEHVQRSTLEQVAAGMKELKDEYREVIALRFLDELSVGEIAKVVGKSRGAVRVLIHRALKALREST